MAMTFRQKRSDLPSLEEILRRLERVESMLEINEPAYFDEFVGDFVKVEPQPWPEFMKNRTFHLRKD